MSSIAEALLSPVSLFLFALAGGLVALILPRLASGSWTLNLTTVIVAFLGAGLIPYGLVLMFYPMFNPKPSLDLLEPYLPLAGIALIMGRDCFGCSGETLALVPCSGREQGRCGLVKVVGLGYKSVSCVWLISRRLLRQISVIAGQI